MDARKEEAKDDAAEKTHEPYEIDMGKATGAAALNGIKATVMSEAQLANEGVPHICMNRCPEETLADARISGSTIVNCSLCAGEVWLAPSGQRIQARGKNPLVCFDCFRKMMACGHDRAV